MPLRPAPRARSRLASASSTCVYLVPPLSTVRAPRTPAAPTSISDAEAGVLRTDQGRAVPEDFDALPHVVMGLRNLVKREHLAQRRVNDFSGHQLVVGAGLDVVSAMRSLKTLLVHP